MLLDRALQPEARALLAAQRRIDLRATLDLEPEQSDDDLGQSGQQQDVGCVHGFTSVALRIARRASLIAAPWRGPVARSNAPVSCSARRAASKSGAAAISCALARFSALRVMSRSEERRVGKECRS